MIYIFFTKQVNILPSPDNNGKRYKFYFGKNDKMRRLTLRINNTW